MYPKLTHERLEAAKEAYERGMRLKDIEKDFGVSLTSLNRYAFRHEWVRPKDYMKGRYTRKKEVVEEKPDRPPCPSVNSKDIKEHFIQTCKRLMWLLEENTNHKS